MDIYGSRIGRSLALSMGILLLLAARTLGQTLPTTEPAFDQSTPRGAFKLFIGASVKEDGDAMRNLLAGDDKPQKDMIGAMADKKDADRILTDALKAHFPADWKTDPRQQAIAELSQIYDRIDHSILTIDGDTATLSAPGSQSAPITFKRVDGVWKIPLAVLFQSIDADKLEHDVHQIEIQVKVMRDESANVSAGKYATQEQAMEAVKQAMFNAGVADHKASQGGQ